MRIAVLGLGGVIGGMLAARYPRSKEVEVVFVARGENKRAIETGGLRLITPKGEQVVHPAAVSDRPEDLDTPDLVLCCVKSYDLESAIESMKPSAGGRTVFLPLLNGIDAAERIWKIIRASEVWTGCVYLVAALIRPGVVKMSGSLLELSLGAEDGAREKLAGVEAVLRSAGIDARVRSDISGVLWEKFLFISPLATLTSALDCRIGEIVSDAGRRDLLARLVNELRNVADAGGVSLPGDIVKRTLERVHSLPPEATSSMHRDFQAGSRTEVDSLTGHVVRLGEAAGIPTPAYRMLLEILAAKTPASA